MWQNLKDRLSSDEGTMTVEFVIMFPLVAIWFAMSFQFFATFRSNSQTSKVAYTIADIASREQDHEGHFDAEGNPEIGFRADELESLFALQKKMMPRRVNHESLRISSICFREGDSATDSDDLYRVLWSWASDSTGVPELDVFVELQDDDIPEDIMPIMADQDTILFVEVAGTWHPVSTPFYKPSDFRWSNKITIRPRVFPPGISGVRYFPDHTNTFCADPADDPGA